MEQKKVPHDPLTIAASCGGQTTQGFSPAGKHLGAYLGSPRVVAVEEDVPVARHRDLGPVNAPQALLKLHESPR
ncbi:MAG: hypothetical protein ACLQU3_14110 [Limisphaerales bacterium]